MDTGLLTSQAVDTLRSQCSRTDSDAIAVATILPDGTMRDARAFQRGTFGQSGWHGTTYRAESRLPESCLSARIVSVAASFERLPDSDASDQLQIAA